MAVRTAQPRSPKVPEIRKGDTVVVLAGKDAGKRGTVEQVIRRQAAPSSARSVFRRGSSAGGVSVVVEGLNIAKRHTKPRQSAGTTDRVPKMQQGGILDIAQPIPVSKVMLICTNCGKPTRIAHATLDTGRRVRVCEQLEVKS
jgi:large subunit ribosomal protein L24